MYNAYVTKIKNVKKHSNADKLNVGECFGNQVIVSLETKEGDIGIFFPSDGQLGVEYCQANDLIRRKDENGNAVGGYLDENKRNIRPMKLRGEISDGLFMPLTSLSTFTDITKLKDGEIITVLNGVEICKKYVPSTTNKPRVGNGKEKLAKEKAVKYTTFHEHIDTSQLAYNLGKFKEGMICYLTLKMHGTSGRTSMALKEEKVYKNGFAKLLAKLTKKPLFEIIKSWACISGTRRVVLETYDGGYYESNNFRKRAHDLFDGKLQKGETVYYEIVGFEDSGRPIMGEVSNKTTNDKEFIKKYGEKTVYSYGCEKEESEVYLYRMSITNEDGFEIDYPWDLVLTRAEQMGVKTVPEFDRFIYTNEEDLMERVNKYVDGVDPIGLTHIREGVVVRVEGGEKFKAYKHKNFTFRLLEGIIKDSGVIDTEEAESMVE